MELTGRRYDTGEPIRVRIDGDRIAAVDHLRGDEQDAALPWIAPGLFDLQVNGYGGTWFAREGITAQEVLRTIRPYFSRGLTRLCPTLVTNSHEALLGGFAAVDEACRREPWADEMVAGCHLEGPCISPEDGPRGAHPLEHVRPLKWEQFRALQRASGDRIRLVTLAPEVEGALEFIEKATDAGVVVAIGHTAAEPEQIRAAVDAGARLSTHLGNGAHGVLRRHPNYIWEQLGEPRLWASIITDGHHLPASVVRSIVGVKGIEQTILTCDASGLAGCPPGIYDEGSVKVEVLEDGRLVIAGQRQLLAGSGAATDDCVAEVIRMAGVSLGDAITMASRNPARLLGLEPGRLEPGGRADLIRFHFAGAGSRLDVRQTVAAGQIQYEAALNPEAGRR